MIALPEPNLELCRTGFSCSLCGWEHSGVVLYIKSYQEGACFVVPFEAVNQIII